MDAVDTRSRAEEALIRIEVSLIVAERLETVPPLNVL
jgi:hypothetical protein